MSRTPSPAEFLRARVAELTTDTADISKIERMELLVEELLALIDLCEPDYSEGGFYSGKVLDGLSQVWRDHPDFDTRWEQRHG